MPSPAVAATSNGDVITRRKRAKTTADAKDMMKNAARKSVFARKKIRTSGKMIVSSTPMRN
jgi:hypothetical protein